MSYWLFSGKPEKWTTYIEDIQNGGRSWYMTSYQDVKIGDQGFVKIGGNVQGIFAKVKIKSLNNKPFIPKDKKKHVQDITFEVIKDYTKKKIEYASIQNSALKNKLKNQGSSFKLTDNEFKILEKLTKDEKMTIPLNQILYGPPGTGKTYNTIDKALEVILQREEDTYIVQHTFNKHEINQSVEDLKVLINKDELTNEERKDLKTAFDFYKEQIQFVTFHQSYGYEEFVEGIKADLNNQNIKYKLEEGVFKKLCKEAQKRSLQSITIDSNSQILTKDIFRDLYNNFTNNLIDKDLKIASNYTMETKTGIKFDLFKNSSPSIVVKSGNERTSQSVSHNELEKVLFENKKPTYSSYENIIITEILKSFNYKKESIDNTIKNYVLIIDEINRGNISKIFGELITLIEPSKRIGKDEQITLRLPNSPDEEFGVPSNLYIIGTMNTADRSIAPIDTALRRRFKFAEMPPKPDLLNTNIEGINLQEMLIAINARIEYIYDRDHTIGHSYFMDVKTFLDLKNIFKDNIIPLLAEYFYEDWENIKLVLNDDDNKFILESEIKKDYLADIKDKKHIRTDKKIYKVGDSSDWKKCQFKNIYNEECDALEREDEVNNEQ